MGDETKQASGCLVAVGWALLTAGPAAAVGVLWHPAMGAALWMSANGAMYLLAAAKAGK